MAFAFLGILIGASFVLLFREWMEYARERRDPSAHADYARRSFQRRAMVSLMLLAIAALVVSQPLYEATWSTARARLAYLSAYLIVVVYIYVLLWTDFVESRKMAILLRAELAAAQAKYVADLQRIYGVDDGGATGGRVPGDSQPIALVSEGEALPDVNELENSPLDEKEDGEDELREGESARLIE